MGFGNTYRRILASGSASHVWIDLHRLVESFCRTVGRPFTDVFAELERRFEFSRTVRARWPELATMRAAAEWLRAERDVHLAARRAWIAEQRRRKAASQRERVPDGLREAEARSREQAARRRPVGCWGWRIDRERQTSGR